MNGARFAHAARIREVASRIEGITVFAGIECDIRPDGTLDLAEDCLASLDLVIASVHSALNQDDVQMTERMLRAIESPVVDIVGHPTGRLLLRREPSRVSVTRLIDAAARFGVALEINSLPDRLDLSDVHARLARDRGVKLLISSDSHASSAFAHLRWGVAHGAQSMVDEDGRAQHAAGGRVPSFVATPQAAVRQRLGRAG